MHKVLDTMLIDGEPDIPFMLNWVNESWTKKWDGLDKDITLKQDYGNEEEWSLHFDYLLPFFKHKNYIKKDKKPVFIIYHITKG